MPRRLKWLNQGMVMGIQPTANVKLICSSSIDEIRTLSHMLGMIGWMNTVNVNVPVRLRPKKTPAGAGSFGVGAYAQTCCAWEPRCVTDVNTG
ncbi:hypothetical protein BC360_02685 [Ensifer sp. LC163]|nr:hypothetical protein BC360_02685 [Ensifer sp. LC163]